MHFEQLHSRQAHGSPERRPGALFRAMAQTALNQGLFSSKESLARRLSQELQELGITYHIRTLRRQLSGSVASVPPEVESALSKLVLNGTGQRSEALIRQQGTGPEMSSMRADAPPYLLSEKVLPLAKFWLHLNPRASKRALARRLQRDLEKQGVMYAVGALEAVLAGRNWFLIRAVIREKLLDYLRESGINSSADAESRMRDDAEQIRLSLVGRELAPIRRFRQLSLLWLLRHRSASPRQLSIVLQYRLSERGPRISVDHIQRAVAGRPRYVRRLLEMILEDLLRSEFPRPGDLEAALTRYSRAIDSYRQDMGWIRADAIAAIARNWVQQHPGTSMRQLAIRLAGTIRRMGYSMSPGTIQPILGGWKKKARRFVYRAILFRCGPLHSKCTTKGCVYPPLRDGLCRMCWLRKREPQFFRRREELPTLSWGKPYQIVGGADLGSTVVLSSGGE